MGTLRISFLFVGLVSLLTAASGAETSGARLYHEALDERLNSIRLGQEPYVKTGYEPAERGTPGLTVKIKAGQGNVGGVDVRKGFGSWTRSSATITITEENHGRSNGNTIDVDVTSSAPALPLQEYVIANKTDNTFEVTGVDAGDPTGTSQFSTILGPVVAPGSNTRLDYLVANSDNSLSIITGTPLVDPIFPAVASTQLIVGCLVVTAGDTTLNDGAEIFQLIHNDDIIDQYIGTATTLAQGKYVFSNLIIDAAVTIDCTSATGVDFFQRENVIIKCLGNYRQTALGTIAVAGAHVITSNANDGADGGINGGGVGGLKGLNSSITSLGSGKGGRGNKAGIGNSGGGGAGGASLVSSGGAGGNSTGGSGGATLENNNATHISPLIMISAFNIYVDADITNGGFDGTVSTESGGGGGSGGGAVILISKNDITITALSAIALDGGDGSDADLGDRGGGGGGAGGLFFARSKTYTNNGSVTLTGGTGGALTGTGTIGTNGEVGITDQNLYTDLANSLLDNIFPLNMFGIEI